MLDIEDFIDKLSYTDPNYPKEISQLEVEFNCKISCAIEKHNSLQHTFFYEVDFNEPELFYVEIESGINNGTRVNSAEWGIDTKSKTKMVTALKNVIFSEKKFKQNYKGTELYYKRYVELAAHRFRENKSKILELYRKQNYDNYVTGGGTNKTDEHYKKKVSELSDKGVYWDCVYEEIEVDCNFI